MKRIFIVLLMLIFILTLAANGNTVEASSPTHNTDLMLISITDVEIANEIANGDGELFVETLAQMGYDNYNSGSSSEVPGMYEIFGFNLTSDEVALLLTNPLAAPFWVSTAQKALSTTPNLYPNEANDGQLGNSFQHAYWNVLMVKYIGVELVEAFATAHEERPNNPWIHKHMDLHNNEKGRELAITISWIAFKSDSTLATMTQELVENGDLKYILFEYEYIHTYIYYDNNVIDPVYELGDFHSYTDGATPIYLPEIQIDDRRSEPGPIIMPMSLLPEDEEVLINVE